MTITVCLHDTHPIPCRVRTPDHRRATDHDESQEAM